MSSGDVRLRWIANYVASGPSPTCEDRTSEGDEWGVLKTTAIRWSGWSPEEHKVLPVDYWGARHLEVRKGDVIVTKAGPRHRVGVSAIVPETPPRLIVSGKMVLLRINPQLADSGYVNFALSTPPAQAFLDSCKTGMAESQMNFANEDLLGMRLPLPPLAEQRRIVKFLDDKLTVLTQLERRLVELRKGIDRREQAVRDKVIDELAHNTAAVALRRLVRAVEQGSSPQCDAEPRRNGEWGVLKLSAVKDGSFLPSENKKLPEDVEPILRYELRTDDLLITRANTPDLVGDVAVVEGESDKLLLPDLIYRVSLEPGVEPRFLAQVLRTTRMRGLVRSDARGTSQSMVKLRGEDIRSWLVPSTSRSRQRRTVQEIEEGVSPLTDLRIHLKAESALLIERRQALISAALTGQVDVTTARGIEV